MRKVDIDKNINELCREYPELIDILAEVGFKDIVNPLLRKTVGKVITLRKGAEIKKISIGSIENELKKN